MSVALLRKARSSLSYPLAASVRAGGRVWHSPAPTRYRFAVQSADSQSWLFKHNRELDPNWTAPAWARAWAPITTAATVHAIGGTKPNGTGEAAAMWTALLDVRMNLERMEKVLKSVEKQTASVETLRQLIKEIKRPSSSIWKTSFIVLVFAALYALVHFVISWVVQTITIEVIDQFCVERLNNIVADPETQENINKLVAKMVDTLKSKVNPLQIFSPTVEEKSYGEVVDKDTVLCLQILLIVHIVHGPTADAIVQKINIISKEDPARVREMMKFLEHSLYIEVMETPRKIRTYWPSKRALNDSASGELETKVKALVKTKVKAALKDAAMEN